ncbi:hypothetical protein RR48_12393 [Papilio machaon]|uniref:Uncharacterized protein n=1 Tax=Papilio machaon TaxID=76193 RepID=A0A194RMY4_PAPMA|nr:hypothetical protein RR48_12393 [Papilio machaon]
MTAHWRVFGLFTWITMETAGLPLPGYHYIAPNHIVKAPIH